MAGASHPEHFDSSGRPPLRNPTKGMGPRRHAAGAPVPIRRRSRGQPTTSVFGDLGKADSSHDDVTMKSDEAFFGVVNEQYNSDTESSTSSINLDSPLAAPVYSPFAESRPSPPIFQFGQRPAAEVFHFGVATPTPSSSSHQDRFAGKGPIGSALPTGKNEHTPTGAPLFVFAQTDGPSPGSYDPGLPIGESRQPNLFSTSFEVSGSSVAAPSRPIARRGRKQQSGVEWSSVPESQPPTREPTEDNPNEATAVPLPQESEDSSSLLEEDEETSLQQALCEAQRLAKCQQYRMALQTCAEQLVDEQVRHTITDLAQKWEENHQNQLVAARNATRESNNDLRRLSREKESCVKNLLDERAKNERLSREVARLSREARGADQLLQENARLKQQLRNARQGGNHGWSKQLSPAETASFMAQVECTALHPSFSSKDKAAVKKKLLLKWHPDKQPGGGENASLATLVMQEMQNRPEWQ